MKTRYTAFQQIGCYTNFNFNPNEIIKIPGVHKIVDNKTKQTLFERDHIFVGYISTGIRMIGKVKVYECSDSKQRITCTGDDFNEEIKRFSKITKNRKSETVFINADF